METVQFQIFVFSITLYGGMLIGVLYDIYRAVKGTRRTKGLITSLWDILFLIMAFFIVVYIIFSSNFGDMRAYVFIGFIVGFFLYEKIIGRIFEAIFSKIFETLNLMIRMGGNYASLPLRLLWRLLVKPAILIKDYIKNKAKKIKKIALIPKKALKECKKYYKLIIKRDKH